MTGFFHNWLRRWFAETVSTASGHAPDEAEPSSTDDPFPDPVELEITDVFDLHSIPPKQIKAVVEEYLFQAHARGFPVVRLIHGKGIGAQREQVRAILKRTHFVSEFHDAPDASSWGATIAYLQTEPLISEGVSASANARLE